jgi:hypothetical protein
MKNALLAMTVELRRWLAAPMVRRPYWFDQCELTNPSSLVKEVTAIGAVMDATDPTRTI